LSHVGYHPKTRSDAPDIPQDLATKRYVDDNEIIALSVSGVNTSNNIDNLDGQFLGMFGKNNFQVVESIVSVPIASSGTIKRCAVSCTVNTSGNNATLKTRIGGSTGNNTITITAGNTGIFSSASDDIITEDDLIDYLVNHVTDASTLVIRGISTSFEFV